MGIAYSTFYDYYYGGGPELEGADPSAPRATATPAAAAGAGAVAGAHADRARDGRGSLASAAAAACHWGADHDVVLGYLPVEDQLCAALVCRACRAGPPESESCVRGAPAERPSLPRNLQFNPGWTRSHCQAP